MKRVLAIACFAMASAFATGPAANVTGSCKDPTPLSADASALKDAFNAGKGKV